MPPRPGPTKQSKPKRFLWIGGALVVLALGAIGGCNAMSVSRAIARAEAQRPRDPKTGIRIGAEAFAHHAGEPACLLLHGFEVTPQIYREMAQRLADAGISSRAILFPGHGATLADFAASRAADWVAAAERAYDDMLRQHRTVYVIGFSMGGTVALDLAERRDVAGVVCLAPFLRITRKWFHIVRAESMSRFARWVGFPRVVKNIPLDVADVSVRPRVINAGFTPIATACSLFDLADQTRSGLGSITCPLLVLHGRLDRVADPRESQRLIEQVKSDPKRLVLLDHSAHLLPMDYDKERVFAETIAFIREQEARRAARQGARAR